MRVMSEVYHDLIKRIKVSEGVDPCHEFQGSLELGYGRITVNGKGMRVHRFMYKYHKGPISPNLIVLHRCNNRKCCNPGHLVLGTHQDNSDHAKESGTTSHLNRRELNEEQVLEIRRLLKAGVKRHLIAKQFRTHSATIRYIDIGRTYQDIQPPLDETEPPKESVTA